MLSAKIMYIDFDKITDNARVWVYQANRLLQTDEVRAIETALRPALNGWAAHGEPLLAAAKVVENRFIVIAVDEGHHLPSGCSIDASVHFLRQIGQQFGVDFFDRSAAFTGANGEVQTLALPEIKGAVAGGVLAPDTIVFNTLVKTKTEFLTNWQLRANETWLKRYFLVKQSV